MVLLVVVSVFIAEVLHAHYHTVLGLTGLTGVALHINLMQLFLSIKQRAYFSLAARYYWN